MEKLPIEVCTLQVPHLKTEKLPIEVGVPPKNQFFTLYMSFPFIFFGGSYLIKVSSEYSKRSRGKSYWGSQMIFLDLGDPVNFSLLMFFNFLSVLL